MMTRSSVAKLEKEYARMKFVESQQYFVIKEDQRASICPGH